MNPAKTANRDAGADIICKLCWCACQGTAIQAALGNNACQGIAIQAFFDYNLIDKTARGSPHDADRCVPAISHRSREKMPFQIIRHDITKVKADAIVNVANAGPVFSGETNGRTYKAAGEENLLAGRRKIGRIPVGGAAITHAFGLKAGYIIHTVGPVWQGGEQGEARAVRLCYRNSLRLAREHGCESIAFPLISAGANGLPRGEALRIALAEIGSFLADEDMLVWLVVFDGESFSLPEKLSADIASYIDAHYAADRTAKACDAVCAGVKYNSFAERPTKVPSRLKRSGQLSKQAMAVRECSLEYVVAQLGETFQQRLFRLIDERSLTDVEVYKKANLDRKLFSKIRCNTEYRPKKITAVALAVALELNLDETKDLLSRAEMALSPSSKFDLIITYFIERKVYDIYTINAALFQHQQPLLGCG